MALSTACASSPVFVGNSPDCRFHLLEDPLVGREQIKEVARWGQQLIWKPSRSCMPDPDFASGCSVVKQDSQVEISSWILLLPNGFLEALQNAQVDSCSDSTFVGNKYPVCCFWVWDFSSKKATFILLTMARSCRQGFSLGVATCNWNLNLMKFIMKEIFMFLFTWFSSSFNLS